MDDATEQRLKGMFLAEWQPMSAAPTDGTLILAYDGSHMATARWCEPLKEWWSEDVCLDVENIAAWMPLPDPPEEIA